MFERLKFDVNNKKQIKDLYTVFRHERKTYYRAIKHVDKIKIGCGLINDTFKLMYYIFVTQDKKDET
jgi:hypothetical protein